MVISQDFPVRVILVKLLWRILTCHDGGKMPPYPYGISDAAPQGACAAAAITRLSQIDQDFLY